ncbi:Uracil DNA glycosylase superfamily protein [Aquimixticola soesokkakensis]|uniref:Type-4 uracil-DNA glycosylase n=1 Tax=Aquimixticola soesokkakensis TaxID=1519096 RepID=A0A1Y5RMW5_9RHOB|nr:uracil-DNA glycosylase [Aquimixticola soesokkakensis]SLN21166.1 Uracil DNA glycosylase superfamily protein [Aquimixticola soesokkakensis]
MNAELGYWEAHALLEWHLELGVDEAICDAPVNRYDLPDTSAKPPRATPSATERRKAPPKLPPKPEIDCEALAVESARGAGSLEALRSALEAFEHCDLKRGARSLVFGDGNPRARVMIIGDMPDRDEDQQGKPFVGKQGALFDAMFGAIGLSRDAPDTESAIYATPMLPWHPPQNRDPSAADIAMMRPFLLRHIALVDPAVVVLMGNWACMALMGRAGITRMRGDWSEVAGKPALPMLHPSYLLRRAESKREAWADLLELQARLRVLP